MVMTLYTIVPVLAVMGVSVYVLVLLIRALRKYLRTAPVRAEKAETAKTLGAVLKQHRTACKMTQEFVAESIGVSRQAVSKWESGASDPSTSNLLALAKLFGVSAEELLRQTDIPVREIAPRVGYTDANYFTKVFKRHCGCTPTDYRSRL